MTISKFDISLDVSNALGPINYGSLYGGWPSLGRCPPSTHRSGHKTESYTTAIVTGSPPERMGLSQR